MAFAYEMGTFIGGYLMLEFICNYSISKYVSMFPYILYKFTHLVSFDSSGLPEIVI